MFTVQNSQRLIQNSLTPEGQEKCKQIMFHLCRIIQNHNTTPQQICINYGKFDITIVDLLDFKVMINRLDPSLTSLDLQILFTVFDNQNQGQITFLQFKNQLISFYNQFLVYQQQQNQEMSMDMKMDFQNEIVIYFARECVKNRTDLKKLFNDFQQDSNSIGLKAEDFKKMILNVNNRLTDNQIQKAYEIFDLQQDNIVTYKEFETTINRFTPKNIGIYRIIQEIRRHNIDLQLFFNNFNKNDADILDFNEFENMIKRIINNFTPQQTELIFRKFDYRGERQITFQRFKDVIQKYFFEDTVPDMKTEAAIAKLVKEIKVNNHDPQQLFNNYDRSKDTKLDLFEFGILLRQIDSSLNEREVQLAFDKFDIDKDKNVTFQEFVDTLQTFYQISVQPYENKNLIIFKLVDQIVSSGQNLQSLFKDIDVSGDRQLDIFEFGSVLTKIDNTLSQQDIELAFEEFDLDGDRNISYEEFQETVQKLQEESKKQLNKSKMAIKKIVDMIKQLNIDVQNLFERYDVNKDGVLNGMEFIQMMKGYDEMLTDSELQDAFYEFDSDRNGEVDFNEFIKCLQKYYAL